MTFDSIRHSWYSRSINFCLIVAFVATMVITPRASYAQEGVMGLPQPGEMVNLSPAYVPLMLTGLTIHPENPLLMDFIVSTGNSGMNADQVKKGSDRLIKYFLACLTIPENHQWVNLSPYEKQRIVPEDLGQTVLGQDMLAQDYLLKQLTASLIYPEKNLGKNFWDKVYAQARQEYGTTQIPVNTFNKVWILPEYAKVYEHNNTVLVVKSHLKVMLDEDYLALSHHVIPAKAGIHNMASRIVRQLILPSIEQEVNHGRNFAQLRQIYNSMILAVWFKNNLKQALLNQVYTDKSKVNGVNVNDPMIKEKIYQQYLQAYKKGVFNYIKEEPIMSSPNGNPTLSSPNVSVGDPAQPTIARKYFSGGEAPFNMAMIHSVSNIEASSTMSSNPGDYFELKGKAGQVPSATMTAEQGAQEVIGRTRWLPPLETIRVRSPLFTEVRKVFPNINHELEVGIVNLLQWEPTGKKREDLGIFKYEMKIVLKNPAMAISEDAREIVGFTMSLSPKSNYRAVLGTVVQNYFPHMDSTERGLVARLLAWQPTNNGKNHSGTDGIEMKVVLSRNPAMTAEEQLAQKLNIEPSIVTDIQKSLPEVDLNIPISTLMETLKLYLTTDSLKVIRLQKFVPTEGADEPIIGAERIYRSLSEVPKGAKVFQVLIKSNYANRPKVSLEQYIQVAVGDAAMVSSYHEQRAQELLAYANRTNGGLPMPTHAIKRMFRIEDVPLNIMNLSLGQKRELWKTTWDYFRQLSSRNGHITWGNPVGGSASRMAKGRLPQILIDALKQDPEQFVDVTKFTAQELMLIRDSFGGDYRKYVQSLNPNIYEEHQVLDRILYEAKALLPADKPIDGRWYNLLGYNAINVKRINDELQAKGLNRLFIFKIMPNDDNYKKILQNLVQNNFYGLKVSVIKDALGNVVDIDHSDVTNELEMYNQGLGYRLVAPVKTVEAQWAIDRVLLEKAAVEQNEEKRMAYLKSTQLKSEAAYRYALAFSQANEGKVLYNTHVPEGHGERFHALFETTSVGPQIPMIIQDILRNVEYDYFHNIDNMAALNDDWMLIFGYMLKNKLLMVLESSLRPSTERGGGGGFDWTEIDNGHGGKELVYRQTEDTVTKASLGKDIEGRPISPEYDQKAEDERALKKINGVNNLVPVNNASEFNKVLTLDSILKGEDIISVNLSPELRQELSSVLRQAIKSGNYKINLRKFSDALRKRFSVVSTIKSVADPNLVKPSDDQLILSVVNETFAWSSQEGALPGQRMHVVLTPSIVDVEERGYSPEMVRFDPLKDRPTYDNPPVAQRVRGALLRHVLKGELLSKDFYEADKAMATAKLSNLELPEGSVMTLPERAEFLQGVRAGRNLVSIIKPDAMNRSEEVIAKITEAGFKVKKTLILDLTKEEAREIYAVHNKQTYFESQLIPYMTQGPVMLLFIEGKDENAIDDYRDFTKRVLRPMLGAVDTDTVHTKIHAPDSGDKGKGYGPEYEAKVLLKLLPHTAASQAMTTNADHAVLAKPIPEGGIDLNSRNLNLESSGQKVNIAFDPVMIAQFRRGDFSGVTIQILDVVPISLMPLLGLKEDDVPGQLAKI